MYRLPTMLMFETDPLIYSKLIIISDSIYGQLPSKKTKDFKKNCGKQSCKFFTCCGHNDVNVFSASIFARASPYQTKIPQKCGNDSSCSIMLRSGSATRLHLSCVMSVSEILYNWFLSVKCTDT
jgi:hypothetical protein